MRPAPENEPGAPQGRILVVDDNRDSATSLGMMLKLMGNETRTAHDGLAAVQAAEQFRPDLILLDMMMPGRTGLDVLEALRASPETAATPVVMVTARAQSSDRRAAADAGADRFVTKPFSPTELLRTVDELLVS